MNVIFTRSALAVVAVAPVAPPDLASVARSRAAGGARPDLAHPAADRRPPNGKPATLEGLSHERPRRVSRQSSFVGGGRPAWALRPRAWQVGTSKPCRRRFMGPRPRSILPRAIHVALENILERRSCRFQTKLHLFKKKLGLALDRRVDDLARGGVEWRKARHEYRIAMPRHRRLCSVSQSRRIAPVTAQICGIM
jgi:hypothetical protein